MKEAPKPIRSPELPQVDNAYPGLLEKASSLSSNLDDSRFSH
jgi:hypothetical protein